MIIFVDGLATQIPVFYWAEPIFEPFVRSEISYHYVNIVSTLSCPLFITNMHSLIYCLLIFIKAYKTISCEVKPCIRHRNRL